MKTRENIIKHFIFSLMTALFLFAAAQAFVKIEQHNKTPEKITSRFQEQLNSAFTSLQDEISTTAKILEPEENDFFKKLRKEHQTLFRDKGVEILIYCNDSLKYWSFNAFQAEPVLVRPYVSGTVLKTGNGYYLTASRTSGQNLIVAMQLLKSEYKYSNEYLPAGFFKKFAIPSYVGISLGPGHFNIRNLSGQAVCSLQFAENFKFSGWLMYLLLSMYTASFLFVVLALFYAYTYFIGKFGHRWMFLLFFVCDTLILRFLQFYFHFPGNLYSLDLFSPVYYASSNLLPSLGDLFINAVLLLQIALILLRHSPLKPLQQLKNKPWLETAKALLIAGTIACIYYLMLSVVRGLVFNSKISFSFEDFFNLSAVTNTGMFIISALALSVLILSEIACFFLRNRLDNKLGYFVISGLATTGFFLLSYTQGVFDWVTLIGLAGLFLLLFFRAGFPPGSRLRVSRIISSAILLSAVVAYTLNKAESSRELNQRKILASHLAEARDNMAEYFYGETSRNIENDRRIAMQLQEAQSDSILQNVASQIRQTYFSGFWQKYQVQVTVCTPGKKLIIKPTNVVTDCKQYFDDYSNKFMQPTTVPGLFFLKQSVDARYYLGKISITTQNDTISPEAYVFVEISSADIWKGLGYPELLTDRQKANVDNLTGYSYAFYNKGELVKNLGKYSYPMLMKNVNALNSGNNFYNELNYSHLAYKSDNNTLVVLSREIPRLSDLVSPFSYILLTMLLMVIAVRVFTSDRVYPKGGIFTFRWRLQLIMVLVIVISSVILVTVSLLFINQLNRNKNNEMLNEKLNSVLVDLETRYMAQPDLNKISKDELSNLLLSLSNTYFTDINLFDANGYLLASSRDQIFREGMVSAQLNAAGASRLFVDKATVFIQRENIGAYSFLSAYSPIRNVDNQLLGYINLPYFARQEEIRKEISGLISAFANIYIIMIIATVLLALLLSNYFTRPLQQIGKQFSRVKFANQNAKIHWDRRDEIGQLVEEYNRMIDEISKSAEILARSERESAWREMARQVAHEIKNPLTPIKLNMQLLLRAWQDKDPDWEGRLKRFSQTLIMQIDTLSSIASEFSDFATMPKPEITDFDVIPLVHQTVSLFRNQSESEISLSAAGSECIIKADANQMLRVLNNLLKNALQAIPAERKGIIEVMIVSDNNECLISIKDNGTGIPAELQPRIFSPNFTTKNAGMGLGLAMVKNIMDGLSGRVWFESVPGNGAVFHIALPLA